jgi:2-C-methyl-D-erythritol 4-phosphate cytidylyltransferase
MAGRGKRMGYERNKILLPFGNKYLFEFPLSVFLAHGYQVICVISEEDKDIIVPRLPVKNVKYIYGGATRQESVAHGLRLATGDYVMIHDAARMWIDEDILEQIMEARGVDNFPVLTYLPVKDTIKLREEDKLSTLDRRNLIAASTPQCAPLELFKEVYQRAEEEGFMATDDISLIEKYHPEIEIKLVRSKDETFKVTTPLDYELAKIIWRMKQ